ncbi:serine/arginine repetitive matrix protein 3 [Bos taurus]|uniref:serine/arginine repetitive matrix protein 3 n=1 Tax=Bos taurus TaxID=9913 RepID=UPI0028CBB7D5|nr:serine/arginine repetitive matrix protein 3-like [Bos taurus]
MPGSVRTPPSRRPGTEAACPLADGQARGAGDWGRGGRVRGGGAEVASGGRRRRRQQHSAGPARRGARSYTAAARGAPAASQPALELAADWPPPAGPGASQPPPPSPRRLSIGCGSTPAPPRLLASLGCCGRGRRCLEGAVPQGGGASSGLLGSRGWRKLGLGTAAPEARLSWSLCSTIREATALRSLRSAKKSSPHSPQLEKSLSTTKTQHSQNK